MSKEKIRLIDLSEELRVNSKKLIDFFSKNGLYIPNIPSTWISAKYYNLAVRKFNSPSRIKVITYKRESIKDNQNKNSQTTKTKKNYKLYLLYKNDILI